MKYLVRFVSIVGLFSISLLAYSGEITDIYTTGDTLTTTTLDNIKAAVNDNDTRVTTLEVAPKANIAITAPTVNDDINAGFELGSVWVDTIEGVAYIMIDNTQGSAVWKPLTTKSEVYAIGDVGPAGGWVFFVDNDGRHGLEAAPTDQSALIPWSAVLTNIEARGDGVGGGEMNTLLIVASLGFDSNLYAAGLCANLSITNAGVDYSDWYMPSAFELNLMYLNIGQGNLTLGNVGVFADISYWSSTENSANLLNQALLQDFSNNGAVSANIKTGTRGVRAIRAF